MTAASGTPRPRWDGPASAPCIAEALLAPLPRRLRHSRGTAAAAALAAAAVPPGDTGLLVAAAWLHDIGYAPTLAATGFHPLDGARHLRGIGAPDRLCRLVANHTGAQVEAAARGLLTDLADEFPPEQSPTANALTWADLTTGPDGTRTTPEQRIEEILTRYPPGHPVHTSITTAAPLLLATTARVQARLAGPAAATPRDRAPRTARQA